MYILLQWEKKGQNKKKKVGKHSCFISGKVGFDWWDHRLDVWFWGHASTPWTEWPSCGCLNSWPLACRGRAAQKPTSVGEQRMGASRLALRSSLLAGLSRCAQGFPHSPKSPLRWVILLIPGAWQWGRRRMLEVLLFPCALWAWEMVTFMCQHYRTTWLVTLFLGVSARVFPEEMNVWISELSEVDGPPLVSGTHSICWGSKLNQKVEEVWIYSLPEVGVGH